MLEKMTREGGLNRVLTKILNLKIFLKQLSQVQYLECGSNVVRNNECIFYARMYFNDLKVTQIRELNKDNK